MYTQNLEQRGRTSTLSSSEVLHCAWWLLGCTGQLSVASPQVTQDSYEAQHDTGVSMLFQHVLDIQIRDVSLDLASVPLSSGG